MIDGTSEFSRWLQQRALADEQMLGPPSYFKRMLLFSDLELRLGDNAALGGLIPVGVAFRVSLACGGRCLIASCSLMPWHWLFRLGLKDLDGCLSNISGDLSQTDRKCCVTNCGGLSQNVVGQLDLFLGLKIGEMLTFL